MPEVLTVTLNPAVDVSTSVARLVPSHKLRCAHERRDAGGGGINVARVIRRLGGDAAAAFPSGGPIGALLERLVAAEGVPAIAVAINGDTRESFTVIEEAAAKEYRFVLPGPILQVDEWPAIVSAITDSAARARFVVCSGSLSPGAPNDAYAVLADALRREDMKFVLDASGAALRGALACGVYLAKPSVRELRELVGRDLNDNAAILAAARELVASGQAEVVAVTMGGRGAMLVTRDHAYAAEALPIAAASTVGAGDSFLGGMIWALAAGKALEDAFRHAMAAGASSLMLPGTQLCHQADVLRLADEVQVRRISG